MLISSVCTHVLVGNMLVYLVMVVLCVPHTRGDSKEDHEIKISLHIKDPCWFHKSEDPILVCTVNSDDYHIEWKNDNHVGAHGRPIGKDMSEYNILTSYTNRSSRQEQLLISRQYATSLCRSNQSEFHCENQGYSSPNVYLHIPACDACEDCSTVTGKEPPNNQVRLEVEDPYWFCKGEDPVLICTVSSENRSVLWRHNNDMIRKDEGQASGSPTVYSNSTVRQEKLRVPHTVALSSVRENIPFYCEIPGYRSTAVYPIFILDCGGMVTTGRNRGVASGSNSGKSTSGPHSATVTSGVNSRNTTSDPHDGKVTRLNGVNNQPPTKHPWLWISGGLSLAGAILFAAAVVAIFKHCRTRRKANKGNTYIHVATRTKDPNVITNVTSGNVDTSV